MTRESGAGELLGMFRMPVVDQSAHDQCITLRGMERVLGAVDVVLCLIVAPSMLALLVIEVG